MKPFECGKGYIYIYQRTSDVEKVQSKRISHILLHKIGLSKNYPTTRVQQQEKKNKEKYSILRFFESKYFKYVEMAAHRLFM